MNYAQTLEALAALEGDPVTLVIHPPERDDGLRPIRGALTRRQLDAGDGRAVFTIEHPRDDRWTNPTGVAFGVSRERFVSAQRCGGPGQLGVSFVQGRVRMTVYPVL